MNPSPDQIRSRQTASLATEHWWRSRVEEVVAAFRANAQANADSAGTWELAANRVEYILRERNPR